ncbi:MAG: cbb3-type cytochrome oxidase assembly protein [Chlamydiota bacterium]
MIAKTLDGLGIYGGLLHFTIAATFFGGALIIFIYLWRKGRLDMDEGPAERMLNDDQEEEKNGK